MRIGPVLMLPGPSKSAYVFPIQFFGRKDSSPSIDASSTSLSISALSFASSECRYQLDITMAKVLWHCIRIDEALGQALYQRILCIVCTESLLVFGAACILRYDGGSAQKLPAANLTVAAANLGSLTIFFLTIANCLNRLPRFLPRAGSRISRYQVSPS